MTTYINLPENQRFGYVYMTKNLTNGKMYIGIHKGDSLDINYAGSGKWLKRAFKKYSRDNFINGIIEWADSAEDLSVLEQLYIDYFDTLAPAGYNLTTGGEVLFHHHDLTKQKIKIARVNQVYTEVHRRKMSEAGKGRILSEEWRRAIGEGLKGHVVSEETKRKISEKNSNPSEETRRKKSEWQKGKVLSLKTRNKISEAKKGYKFSDEQLINVRKARLKIANPVNQLSMDNEFIKTWGSIGLASRELGINRNHIWEVAKQNTNRKTAGGYKWEYAS